MEYGPRQIVHVFGILAFLALVVWVLDYWYMNRTVPTPINVNGYYWLATVNMHYQPDESLGAIREGHAAMLVTLRADHTIHYLHNKHHGLMDDDARVLSLSDFDQDGDAMITPLDPLFKKLYLLFYVDGALRRSTLDQSQIRAIQIHREKEKTRYRAVFSNGRSMPMTIAPSNQVYRPR